MELLATTCTRTRNDRLHVLTCAAMGDSSMQTVFADHDIASGRVLVSLTEDHLKEMGVARVGHRLELMGHLEELRRGAGLVPREVALMDVSTLLQRWERAV